MDTSSHATLQKISHRASQEKENIKSATRDNFEVRSSQNILAGEIRWETHGITHCIAKLEVLLNILVLGKGT